MFILFLSDISAKEQSTSYKIEQFTKGTEYFKERLGLSFKKVDGRFCFMHFRPSNPCHMQIWRF